MDRNVALLRATIERINACLTIASPYDSICSMLDWIQDVTQSERIILCQVTPSGEPCITKHVNHSYDPRWTEDYVKEGFQSVDPVISMARETTKPFTWDEALKTAKTTERFRAAIADHGMTRGISIALKSRSRAQQPLTVCSFSLDRVAVLSLDAAFVLENALPIMHQSLADRTAHSVCLTSREIEILKWGKIGKTVWEISQILSLSESTIKFHLKNAYRKLDVTGRAHAVARAIQLGILS